MVCAKHILYVEDSINETILLIKMKIRNMEMFLFQYTANCRPHWERIMELFFLFVAMMTFGKSNITRNVSQILVTKLHVISYTKNVHMYKNTCN